MFFRIFKGMGLLHQEQRTKGLVRENSTGYELDFGLKTGPNSSSKKEPPRLCVTVQRCIIICNQQ
jgi:hypothetical protein